MSFFVGILENLITRHATYLFSCFHDFHNYADIELTSYFSLLKDSSAHLSKVVNCDQGQSIRKINNDILFANKMHRI
jgi:hypothetical protein